MAHRLTTNGLGLYLVGYMAIWPSLFMLTKLIYSRLYKELQIDIHILYLCLVDSSSLGPRHYHHISLGLTAGNVSSRIIYDIFKDSIINYLLIMLSLIIKVVDSRTK